MSSHRGPPGDALSALSSGEIRGNARTFQTPPRGTEAGKQHGHDGSQQQPPPAQRLLSLPIISRRLLLSRQDPWDSCCLLSCALPCLSSIFHVSRSHVSGYLWPWVPGSDRLAAPHRLQNTIRSPNLSRSARDTVPQFPSRKTRVKGDFVLLKYSVAAQIN